MIPMVLARHIQSGLADYVETTFPMTNKPFRGSIRKLAHQEGMLSQEPFVSVKLPFRVVGKHAEFPFPCLRPTYRPYAHQMRAFERISAGESTLVATGTGSGKTECFLYPILDYCYRQRRLGRKGIKAILVYPMNALATDQAKRLAELIHNSPELRNNVTAGMYVGQMSQGGSDKDNHAMTATNIVTSHDELLKNPPDILLTNYKMLDYLLVRPKDSRIWDSNDPDTLKYFVVDELHTFDGAQGTDLACLLRRLTDRLNTTSDDMCFVGTSATMGTEETVRDVCEYASQIFNTTFTPESVVTEDRLRVDEFFVTSDYDDTMPTAAQADRLIELEEDVDPDKYLAYAAQAWLDDAHRAGLRRQGTHPARRIPASFKVPGQPVLAYLRRTSANRSQTAGQARHHGCKVQRLAPTPAEGLCRRADSARLPRSQRFGGAHTSVPECTGATMGQGTWPRGCQHHLAGGEHRLPSGRRTVQRRPQDPHAGD